MVNKKIDSNNILFIKIQKVINHKNQIKILIS